jgi:hypothetical protein
MNIWRAFVVLSFLALAACGPGQEQGVVHVAPVSTGSSSASPALHTEKAPRYDKLIPIESDDIGIESTSTDYKEYIISGTINSVRTYSITIATGTRYLAINTVGGKGDADIDVKFGSSSAAPECSSYSGTNTETCIIQDPTPGTWYVQVIGYDAYSSVKLVMHRIVGMLHSFERYPISGAQGSILYFPMYIPPDVQNFSLEITGGSGDVDVNLKYGSPESTPDCVSANIGNTEYCSISAPVEGVWYIELVGYTAYSSTKLRVQY